MTRAQRKGDDSWRKREKGGEEKERRESREREEVELGEAGKAGCSGLLCLLQRATRVGEVDAGTDTCIIYSALLYYYLDLIAR